MSAKNKDSRGTGRGKRKQIQSEHGWTVITHGLSRVSLDDKEPKQEAASLPPQLVPHLTAEKLAADFKLLQVRWQDTALAAQVTELLAQQKEWRVKEAVCIGIGSFSRDWAHRWRSLWQLVLFLHIVGQLKQPPPPQTKDMEISCYAQDPAFTPLDTAFLSLLSITPLESGLEKKITSDSFVYSPFVDWFLLLPTFLRKSHPLLYVGNEIQEDYGIFAQTSHKKERLDECNEIGRRWLQGKRMVRLMEFEKHANALDGMVVYWREGGHEEGKDEEGKNEEGRNEEGKDKEGKNKEGKNKEGKNK